ncbi:MAG: aspartyl/asparaginyl beta-hydroxylase domain-containing protein [Pseudomonadota bacterium]|nr:aspartyl/asparaginyl beta-hydroxylase domain-containing protein [Pseudomonadota bacterium]
MKTTSVQLKGSFDVARLRTDLEAATAQFQSAPQVGKYHDGSWTGIGLRNFSGDHGNTLAAHTGHSKDTAVMAHCPYFKEILDGIGCPVYVARILFLPPGKVIGEHSDAGFGWNYGMVRLHIPIVTDPRVEFSIGDEDVYWKPGEFWFGDFSKPHSLRNKSDITRVHLVMDCPITAQTLQLFPSDFVEQVRSESDILQLNPVELDEATLRGYCGTLVVRGPLLGMTVPISADVTVDDGMLAVKIRGLPILYHFTPTGDNTFQCNTYELKWAKSPDQQDASLVIGKDYKNGKSQEVTVYKRQPMGVRLFSWVQRLLVGGVWGAYFGVLKIKRTLSGSKHVTEQVG